MNKRESVCPLPPGLYVLYCYNTTDNNFSKKLLRLGGALADYVIEPLTPTGSAPDDKGDDDNNDNYGHHNNNNPTMTMIMMTIMINDYDDQF